MYFPQMLGVLSIYIYMRLFTLDFRKVPRLFELTLDACASKLNQCFFLNLVYASFKTTISS